jgi:hypothetical protein
MKESYSDWEKFADPVTKLTVYGRIKYCKDGSTALQYEFIEPKEYKEQKKLKLK